MIGEIDVKCRLSKARRMGFLSYLFLDRYKGLMGIDIGMTVEVRIHGDEEGYIHIRLDEI